MHKERILQYFELYQKAINEIDDYLEYKWGERTYDDARNRIYQIIGKLNSELTKVVLKDV